jgi:hypothetical protein
MASLILNKNCLFQVNLSNNISKSISSLGIAIIDLKNKG